MGKKIKKVAVVTGGGTGIGRSSALALQESEFMVVICGRRKGQLEETVRLGASGRTEILPVVADVSSSLSVNELFVLVEQKYGRLDVLFNNAGGGAPRVPLDQLDEFDWRRCLDVLVLIFGKLVYIWSRLIS